MRAGGRSRWLGPVLASGASGATCGLAFPDAGIQLLAWVGLVPFLLALRSAPPRRAPALALVFALALWGVMWSWGPRSVGVYFEQPAWVGAAFFLGLVLFSVWPPLLVFALGYRWLSLRGAAALPWLAAAAWAAAELARSRLLDVLFPFGNPWAVLGVSQVGVDRLMQIASVTGVAGVSFLVVAVNAALAEGALAWWRGRALGPGLQDLAIAAGMLACAWGYGAATLRAAGREAARETGVAVGLVQPNLDPEAQWSPRLYGRQLSLYLRETERLAGREPLAIVVWPESAMSFFLEDEPGYWRVIASYLGTLDLELIAGAPRLDGDAFLNSVYLLGPDASVLGRYDKRLLIPFAEYAPWGHLDLLRRSFGEIRAYRPGRPQPPLPTRAGRAGVLICNEAMFAELAAERVREGAQILVNAAHDGWIPATAYAEQQLQLARLRAIEQRRFLIRTSTSGPSAIVDPWGRVQARTAAFREATLVGRVWPRDEPTFYARMGDAFGAACGLLAIVGLALAARRGRPPPPA